MCAAGVSTRAPLQIFTLWGSKILDVRRRDKLIHERLLEALPRPVEALFHQLKKKTLKNECQNHDKSQIIK